MDSSAAVTDLRVEVVRREAVLPPPVAVDLTGWVEAAGRRQEVLVVRRAESDRVRITDGFTTLCFLSRARAVEFFAAALELAESISVPAEEGEA